MMRVSCGGNRGTITNYIAWRQVMVNKPLTAEPMLSTSAANQRALVALSIGVRGLLKEYCNVVAMSFPSCSKHKRTHEIDRLPATPLKNVAIVAAFEKAFSELPTAIQLAKHLPLANTFADRFCA